MTDSMFSKNDKKDLSHEEEGLVTENFISRQIVSEVMNYGVTQNQILKVIEFLAMELENREAMITLSEASKKLQDKNNQISNIITET
jgi:hypothetical protein